MCVCACVCACVCMVRACVCVRVSVCVRARAQQNPSSELFLQSKLPSKIVQPDTRCSGKTKTGPFHIYFSISNSRTIAFNVDYVIQSLYIYISSYSPLLLFPENANTGNVTACISFQNNDRYFFMAKDEINVPIALSAFRDNIFSFFPSLVFHLQPVRTIVNR